MKETEKNIVVREADSGDASAVAGLYRQLVSTLAPDKHVNALEERLAEIRSDQEQFSLGPGTKRECTWNRVFDPLPGSNVFTATIRAFGQYGDRTEPTRQRVRRNVT